MPYRRHWLLAALLLLLPLLSPSLLLPPSLAVDRGAAPHLQVGAAGRHVEGPPIDQRRAIVAAAVELADEEEGPPKALCRPSTIVFWPRHEHAARGQGATPGHLAGAPLACAAQPRAPPTHA